MALWLFNLERPTRGFLHFGKNIYFLSQFWRKNKKKPKKNIRWNPTISMIPFCAGESRRFLSFQHFGLLYLLANFIRNRLKTFGWDKKLLFFNGESVPKADFKVEIETHRDSCPRVECLMKFWRLWALLIHYDKSSFPVPCRWDSVLSSDNFGVCWHSAII